MAEIWWLNIISLMINMLQKGLHRERACATKATEKSMLIPLTENSNAKDIRNIMQDQDGCWTILFGISRKSVKLF
jgi:hypothetical protein